MVIGSEAVEGHDHSDPARHADGTAHDPEEDSELHDQSDPAQHADCAAHDADEDSEAVAAGEADCVDTDEAAMPMGGVATGAGGISGGGSAPVLVAVGLILSVSGLIGCAAVSDDGTLVVNNSEGTTARVLLAAHNLS